MELYFELTLCQWELGMCFHSCRTMGAQNMIPFLLAQWELRMCFHCCWHSGSSEYVSILVGTIRAWKVGTMGALNMFPFLLAQWELGICFPSCCTVISLNIDDNVFGVSSNISFRNSSLLGS